MDFHGSCVHIPMHASMAMGTLVVCCIYIHLIINCRVESTTEQLDEVQASRKEELGQLERSVTRMGGLEKELAGEKQMKVQLTQVKVRQEQELKMLKEKLEEK